MRRNNYRKTRAAVALVVLFTLLGGPQTAFAATTLDVTLPDLSVQPGANFDIPVTINAGGGDVAALDIGVTYDPSVIRITAFPAPAGWIVAGDFSGSAQGAINFGGLSVFGVTGTFGFGTLQASAVGAGGESTTLTVSIDPANNSDSLFQSVTVGTLTNGSVTIAQPPSISIADLTVDEGAGGAALTITTDRSATTDVTVQVDTGGEADTATAGRDYDAVVGGTATIPPGATSTTITVPIIDDTLDELDETFTVTISNPSGGTTIGDDTAIVTIVDDDPAGQQEVFREDGEGLADGQEVPGWTFCNPSDPVVCATVTATHLVKKVGVVGIRVNGDSRRYRILSETLTGRLTVDLWMLPATDSNTNNSFALGFFTPGNDEPDSSVVIRINETNTWFLNTPAGHGAGSAVGGWSNRDGWILGPYKMDWTKVRLVLHPELETVEAYIDDVQVGFAISTLHPDGSPSLSQGVNSIGMHSGRGASGHDSYFDDLVIISGGKPPVAWTLSTHTANIGHGAQQNAGVHGEQVYIIGSNVGGVQYEHAPLQPVGEVGPWTLETLDKCPAFNTEAYGAEATIYADPSGNGFAYVSGGFVGFDSGQRSACSAAIGTDGLVGQWRSEPLMNTPRVDHGLFAHNGYLYAVGGTQSNNGFLRSVEVAKMRSDGTLEPWQITSPMIETRPALGVVTVGNYLYVMGGGRHGQRSDTVERALINADGSLGSWQYWGTGLTGPRINFGVAQTDAHVYIFGGHTGTFGNSPTNTVERADISGDRLGTFSSWLDAAGGFMNFVRNGVSGVEFGGIIYAIGGSPNPNTIEFVQPLPPPSISITSATVEEGGGNAVLAITMDRPFTADVTVQVDTADGTAVAGQDYTAVVGDSATIPTGATSTTTTVPILHDRIDELDETFTVTISNPSGGTAIGDGTAAVTISDNDSTGSQFSCRGVPATIVGTAGSDVIFGTGGADVIVGLAGNDVIDGLDGNDVICGGPGDDVIDGGAGHDKIWGGPGRDSLSGGPGDDLIYGNRHADALYGNDGVDRLFGGLGWDTLSGGAGGDDLYGGPGNDTLAGGPGADLLHGNMHDDKLSGNLGTDRLFGDLGADALNGGLGVDDLYGGPGDDTLAGGEGDDYLEGGGGGDRCAGGPGLDVLAGCEPGPIIVLHQEVLVVVQKEVVVEVPVEVLVEKVVVIEVLVERPVYVNCATTTTIVERDVVIEVPAVVVKVVAVEKAVELLTYNAVVKEVLKTVAVPPGAQIVIKEVSKVVVLDRQVAKEVLVEKIVEMVKTVVVEKIVELECPSGLQVILDVPVLKEVVVEQVVLTTKHVPVQKLVDQVVELIKEVPVVVE